MLEKPTNTSINCIKDIYCERNNRLYTFEELRLRPHKLGFTFLLYNKIIASIPHDWIKILQNNHLRTPDMDPKMVASFEKTTRKAKFAYQKLLKISYPKRDSYFKA